jgi:hypothetical protein
VLWVLIVMTQRASSATSDRTSRPRVFCPVRRRPASRARARAFGRPLGDAVLWVKSPTQTALAHTLDNQHRYQTPAAASSPLPRVCVVAEEGNL